MEMRVVGHCQISVPFRVMEELPVQQEGELTAMLHLYPPPDSDFKGSPAVIIPAEEGR